MLQQPRRPRDERGLARALPLPMGPGRGAGAGAEPLCSPPGAAGSKGSLAQPQPPSSPSCAASPGLCVLKAALAACWGWVPCSAHRARAGARGWPQPVLRVWGGGALPGDVLLRSGSAGAVRAAVTPGLQSQRGRAGSGQGWHWQAAPGLRWLPAAPEKGALFPGHSAGSASRALRAPALPRRPRAGAVRWVWGRMSREGAAARSAPGWEGSCGG